MLYRQKSNTFIRIYDSKIGYIVNKQNNNDSVSEGSGVIFLQALSRNPRSLDEINDEIANVFPKVDKNILRNDIIEFYQMLEEKSFIVSGENAEELNRKDNRFSYSGLIHDKKRSFFEQDTKKTTQEYMRAYFENDPTLVSFQIELSNRCNERCIHCYIPDRQKTTDIDPFLFYKAIDQCADLGVLDLTISGGEPMLHKDFCDFLRYVKKYDFSISVLSNLTLLNDEIISELKSNQITSIQTSLYSMNPLIHDSITQVKGSFIKTRDNILKLIKNDIPLQLSCPTMKQNKDCYIDVMNWAHEHKCRAITDYLFIARHDNTTDNLQNRLSVEEVEVIIKNILDNDKEYQNTILAKNFDTIEQYDKGNNIICGVCISTICMAADGNFFPCPGWNNYVLGNIKDVALHEIWKNSPRVNYLRSLRIKNFPKCSICSDIDFCSLCIVRNANESATGDIFDINEHFCKVAALNKKIVKDWLNKNKPHGVK